MATNMKLITLGNLTTFANEIKAKYATIASLEALQTKVNELVTAGGEPNKLEGVKVNGTALAIAEKMVDILIATGTANGSISVNGADVAVAGLQALAFKAKVSQADLEDALLAVINDKAAQADLNAAVLRIAANEGKLSTLIGSVEGDDAKSVRTISAEEVAKIVAGAPEAYDTLKELADWLANHETDAASMNSAIQTNKTDIANLTKLVGTLPEGAASTDVVSYIGEAIAALGIGDYAKTTEVTSAINTALENYYTKTVADATFVKQTDIVAVTDDEIQALLADTQA